MTTPPPGSSSFPAKLRDLQHLLHPPGVGLLADEDDGEADAVEDEAPSVELQLEPSQHLEETVPCSNQRNKDLVEVFFAHDFNLCCPLGSADPCGRSCREFFGS